MTASISPSPWQRADPSAEKIVIQGILSDPALIVSLTNLGLLPTAFHTSLYRRLYAALQDAYLQRGPVTSLEFLSACRQSGTFTPEELGSLEEALARPPRVGGDPIRAARSLVQLEKGGQCAQLLQDWLHSYKANPLKAYASLGDLATSVLANLEGGMPESGNPQDIAGRVDGYDALYAISTGIVPLDRALSVDGTLPGGFRPKELWTIGMPSGHGKSSTAAFWVAEMARRSLGTVVFELEMGAEAFLFRVLSALAQIPLDKAMLPDRCTQEERDRRAEALRVLARTCRIYEGARRVEEMALRVQAVRACLDVPLALVIVDHIGVMAPGQEAAREREWRTLEGFSMGLKRMAMRFDLTCVAFSQLSAQQEAEFALRNTVTGQLMFRGSAGIYHSSDVAIVAGRHNGLVDGVPDPALRNLSVWTVKKVRLTGNIAHFAVRYNPRTFSYGEEFPLPSTFGV